LEELRPELLVLAGAKERGRPPGTVERRPIEPLTLAPEDVQRAVADAITGYIDMDLVLAVAHGLGALPPRTVAIEVEPEAIEPSERLTPVAAAGLERAIELVREEVARP
jgi:hypothetical protein